MAREHRRRVGFWRPPPPDSPGFEEFVAGLVAEIKAKARPLTAEEGDPPPDDPSADRSGQPSGDRLGSLR